MRREHLHSSEIAEEFTRNMKTEVLFFVGLSYGLLFSFNLIGDHRHPTSDSLFCRSLFRNFKKRSRCRSHISAYCSRSRSYVKYYDFYDYLYRRHCYDSRDDNYGYGYGNNSDYKRYTDSPKSKSSFSRRDTSKDVCQSSKKSLLTEESKQEANGSVPENNV